MRSLSTLIGSARGIAGHHFPGAPAGQPHQVGLIAACGRPAVSKGMPKSVRMQVINTGIVATPLQQLRQSGDGQRALPSQPEC
jgi:hypothetical protein